MPSPGDHAGAILAIDADQGAIDVGNEDPNLAVRAAGGGPCVRASRGPGDAAASASTAWMWSPNHRPFAVPFFSDEGEATVTWEITNTGNTRLDPTAVVEVKGLFGRSVQTLPRRSCPSCYPGATWSVRASSPAFLHSRRSPLQLTITAEDVEVVGTSSYWAVPWVFVGLLMAVVLALLGWRGWRRRHADAR